MHFRGDEVESEVEQTLSPHATPEATNAQDLSIFGAEFVNIDAS